MIKVKDNPGLRRDPQSGAIVNTDGVALREHRMKKQMMERVQQNNEEIYRLKEDISEIKSLLQALINIK